MAFLGALREAGGAFFAENLLDVRGDEDAIRVNQCPSRHANTNPGGSVIGITLVSPPSSQRTELIQNTCGLLIARIVLGHLAMGTFRRYQMSNYDPLGAETPMAREPRKSGRAF